MGAHDESSLLTSLLRDVSRSFYLTLRVLPSLIRHQIGLAYLLARATDTIADTDIVNLADRLDALNRLRSRIAGESNTPLDLGKLAARQGTAAERALLERIEAALFLLDHLSDTDKALVREVLHTITSGQELDLKRFAGASPTNIIALQTEAELDDYTYRVAGCVGEFWTKMCLEHLAVPADLNRPRLIEDGVRFGKGLQLVNILRDLNADLLKGRCYIPEPSLGSIRLAPRDLVKPTQINAFRPLYDGYLMTAEQHLQAGWRYTNTLPFGWVKVRLACAWPILIGLRTISHLRRENPLDGARRVKASRSEVKWFMILTFLTYPMPSLWRGLYDRALRRSAGEKLHIQSA